MGSNRTLTEADRQQALYTAYSTKQAGRLMGGISATQVRGMIEAGELRALDVSKPNAKRKTYRIEPVWIDEWRRSRMTDAA